MLEVLLIIVSIALIIVCLLQTGKTDGIVNALMSINCRNLVAKI